MARSSLALPAGDVAEALDDLGPTLAHADERSFVLRQLEARMDHPDARASGGFGQCERHDGVERRAIADIGLVAALPRKGEALGWDRLEHLAVDGAIPG